jgi:hypothetical protein
VRYVSLSEIWSIVSLKKSSFSIPVSREKDRKPLGHSGQRRLQEVVGSNEIENGIPN